MFKNRSNNLTRLSDDGKTSQKVTTETVETNEGVQTTTTSITCTKDDFDSAFKKLNLDPKKFSSGGTSVTRQIVYTNSAGQKEVIEETVETYDTNNSTEQINNGRTIPPETRQESKPSGKSFVEKLGIKLGKTKERDSQACCEQDSIKLSGVKAGKFENECLKKHNEYRMKHGVPKLVLDDKICNYAKEWADHLASTDRFEHRRDRKYGENIYMKWSSDPRHLVTGDEAVESWYSEIKDYTFGQEPRTLKSGHFTQVIWKESMRMGVAWARSRTGKVLVVANYDPPGNFVGKFTENVPSPNK